MKLSRSTLACRLHMSPCTKMKDVTARLRTMTEEELIRFISTKFCPEERYLGREPKGDCLDLDCMACWAREEIDWKKERLEISND